MPKLCDTLVPARCWGVGVALYFVELDLFMWLSDRSGGLVRFERPSGADILSKIQNSPQMFLRLHTAGFMALPIGFRWFTMLFSLLVLGLMSMIALGELYIWRQPGQRAQFGRAGRVVAGTLAAMFLIPIMFWFTYKSTYIPGRALAYVEFLLVAVFLANLAILEARRPASALTRALLSGGILMLLYGGDGEHCGCEHDLARSGAISQPRH